MEISNVTLSNSALALVEQFNRMSYSGRINFFFAYATMISELGFSSWVSDLKVPKYLHESWIRTSKYVINLQK